ncbi:MAG TPA: DHA2 family efflux MFS transporter permease subunit [Chitinivibrionales bacterium]|nr:DHA2 family efflux MFS transporter permease subunit [Chitinivibrionales bacterium]
MLRQRFVNNIPSLHHEHGSYKWWVLVNIMISGFMVVLDSTVVNTALPKIMASFGISVDVAQWILTAYMLAFGIMLPTSGWIADRFGYKRTYAAGLAVFTLFSFLCGISWSEKSLILMRIGQGLGGGLLQPLGMAIIMREFPQEKRGMAMGFWSISAAASVSLGPMVGGYIADNFDWHLIFNINVPIGIICFMATWVIQREYKTQKARSFDTAGFLSLSVFLGFLLFALASGNAQWNTGGWTSDTMMLCYLASAVGLVVFLVTEFNVKSPLVNLKLLSKYNFGLTNVVMFIFGIGMFGSVFLIPLYLQNVLGYTAFESGMVLFPVGIIQATVGPIAGYTSDKINPKIPISIGIALFTTSFLLNTRLSIFSEHAQIMLPMYLRGVAMGLMFSPLSSVALIEIGRHEMAQASGLINVIRQIGGSFGVAILQTLLTQRVIFHTVTAGVTLDPSSPVFTRSMRALQTHVIHAAGSAPQNAVVQASMQLLSHFTQQVFVWGINDAFFYSAACTAACLVPVLILRTRRKPGIPLMGG